MPINKSPARSRGLDETTIESIEHTMEGLEYILENPQDTSNTPEVVVRLVEDYEILLQRLWGFDENKDHHKYWFRINGCMCPKMDNEDAFGTGIRYYLMRCPYHSNVLKTEVDTPSIDL